MPKSILQIINTSCVQKTARKSTKYARNETILKIGHHAKAIYSPCKTLTVGQKLKFQKTFQNPFYKQFTLVGAKNSSKKHQICEN